MDDLDSSQSKRSNRSRRGETVSPANSKKSNDDTKRKKKPKAKNENDDASVDESNDNMSSESSGSNSMRSCKVVLRRETFDEYLEDDRAVAHSTRARRTSMLTEENLSSHVASPKRSTRAGSVASDVLEPIVSRTRSKRTTASQNTPAKEKTPARRSSRLISENEKTATQSPARRNLRSNSTISEDISPPITRARGTPVKARGTPLKSAINQIKKEAVTPRRSSGRFKSIVTAKPIDEETSENEEEVDKKKKTKKAISKLIDSDLEDEINNGESNDNKSSEPANEEPEDVKPIIGDDGQVIAISASPKVVESPRTASKSRSLILVSTSTAESSLEITAHPIAQSPTGEPMEPMEESMSDQAHYHGTPKGKSPRIAVQSKTPQVPTQTEIEVSSELDSSKTAEESIRSPIQSKSNNEPSHENLLKNTVVEEENETVGHAHEADNSEPAESALENAGSIGVSNLVEKIPEIETDAEPMDVSYQDDNDDAESRMISEEGSKPKPKSKSRPSFSAFNTMNITGLVDDTESDAQKSKELPNQRKALPTDQINETVVEETFIGESVDKQVEETTEVMEQAKSPAASKSIQSATPKAKQLEKAESMTPKKKPYPLSNPSVARVGSIDDSFGGDVSSSLSSEIDKLLESMQTPAKFAEPVPAKDINAHINTIAAELGENVGKTSSQLNNTASDDQIQKSANPNIFGGDMELSMVAASQPEFDELIGTPTLGPQNANASKRKSVQISTPKMNKTQTELKRIDTPYPDEKSILEATAKYSKSDEKTRLEKEKKAKARGELLDLIQLRQSWSKKSVSMNTSMPIDKLGLENTSGKDELSSKKAVPARNNWSVSNDNKSHLEESDEEIIPESQEEEEGEEDEKEFDAKRNAFIDDEAEEATDGYESGDSMDSEERREIEDNRIEEIGEDLGSEDTEDESEEEEYEEDHDGFIVDDASMDLLSDNEELEIDEPVGRKKTRRSRIIEQSSSDESDDNEDNSNSVSNDVVSVTMQASVQVEVTTNVEKLKIVEGKFPTTCFTKANDDVSRKAIDEHVVNKLNTEASTKSNVEISDTVAVEQNDGPAESQSHESEEATKSAIVQNVEVADSSNESNIEEKSDDKQTQKSTIAPVEAATEPVEVTTEPIDATIEAVEATTKPDEATTEPFEATSEPAEAVIEPVKPTAQDDTSSIETNKTEPEKVEENMSTKSALNVKLDKSIIKKITTKSNRTSLPGIERIQKDALIKKNSRVSLGDLDPNRQADRFTSLKLPNEISDVKSDSVVGTATERIETEPLNEMNESSDSIKSTNSNAENIPLKLPQEENNNQKAKKGAKVKGTKSQEIITEAGPSVQSDMEEVNVTSTSIKSNASNVTLRKQKRSFMEVDTDTEETEKSEERKLKMLKAVNTASGLFVEETMTPEKKNKFGFNVTPLTPVNQQFRVNEEHAPSHTSTRNKRKSIYLNEDDAQMLLPKPRWQINTQFQTEQPNVKRARKLELGSTEFILQPVKMKKTNIPSELATFRHERIYRPDIPRQSARELIRLKQKKKFSRQ